MKAASRTIVLESRNSKLGCKYGSGIGHDAYDKEIVVSFDFKSSSQFLHPRNF